MQPPRCRYGRCADAPVLPSRCERRIPRSHYRVQMEKWLKPYSSTSLGGDIRKRAPSPFPRGRNHCCPTNSLSLRERVGERAPKKLSSPYLPLPPGEGWGEGIENTCNPTPHPVLLPEEEGTLRFHSRGDVHVSQHFTECSAV